MNLNKSNIKGVFKEVAKKIDPIILRILHRNALPKNHPIADHQIKTGGKRLRPTLAILTCNMMGGKTQDALYPAALLEILHNYTLIIDDIIDHSETRRGKPTTWKKYGQTMAECISMIYAASIFDSIGKSKSKGRVNQILVWALKGVTDGQFYDVLFEQKGREDEDFIVKNRYKKIEKSDYFDMINRKTAKLFQASAEIGGVCAGVSPKKLKELSQLGKNIGMAFQIQDDILDIYGEEKKFGKKIGKDLIERKLGNIVILLAMEELDKNRKNKLMQVILKNKRSAKDIKEGIRLITETEALEKATKLKTKYSKRAHKTLSGLPQNKYNLLINKYIKFLAVRKV
ncbi:polyprenyl synthetase family protein [Patescibacteria group bacterium]